LDKIRDFLNARVQKGPTLRPLVFFIRRVWKNYERIKSAVLISLLHFSRIDNVNQFEASIYSQNGEDGILWAIFNKIGTTNKFCVEFGVQDGRECNTRLLREKRGWTGLLMDPSDQNPPSIKKEFITTENINELFRKYSVPEHFDLLSIDIDGNDYWIWKALAPNYSPRVVVIEYNSKISPSLSKTIRYEPYFQWDLTDYYGASLLALTNLAQLKGYALAGCDRRGVNAFFVRNDLLEGHFVKKTMEELYRPPRFGIKSNGYSWPSSSKTMIDV
jgi:hypothetical protein